MSRATARARRTAEFGALSPVYWVVGPLLNLIPYLLVPVMFAVFRFGSNNGDISVPLGVLIGLIALAIGALSIGSKVVLAEGGLWIRHYGGVFKRFVPYAEITFIDATQKVGRVARSNSIFSASKDCIVFHAVRLTLKSGSRVLIPTTSEEMMQRDRSRIGPDGKTHQGIHSTTRLLMREIQARVDDEESQPEPSPAAAALMRAGRSVTEWHAALARDTPDATDAYRGDARTETLWRVIEDEAAPRDARAGAAIALRSHLDDDGRARLRVVAEGCESPKLRVALDAAIDENTEETEVLAALERASDRTE